MEGPPPVDGDNAQNEIGTEAGKVIGVIGDEDTVTGFLLAGVGMKDSKGSNFLVVNAKTTRDEMEGMFTKLLQRGDVGLIIINQPIADQIRPVIAAHTDTIPMVLEVPASGGSAGAASLKKDPVMKRVLQLLGEE